MSLDQITAKIIEDAKKERERILKSAAEEKSKIIKAAEENAQKLRAHILQKAREDADMRRQTALIKSQMEHNKRMLAVQRQILDSIFTKAIVALPSLTGEKYKNMMQNVLLNAIADGTEEIRLNRSESARLGSDFWKQIGEALRSSGRKTEIKTVIDDSVGDGFIVRGNHEQTDCRISTLIDSIKQELEIDVARLLFSDAQEKEHL